MRGPGTVSRLDVVRAMALRALDNPTDECIPAPAKYVKANGYAEVSWKRENIPAHRVAYEAAHGPIPEGLEVDHVCHSRSTGCPRGDRCMHRRCINPAHLEAVTQAENTRRARALITHCPRDHEYTPENTYVYNGGRQCRACGREYAAAALRRLRAVQPAQRRGLGKEVLPCGTSAAYARHRHRGEPIDEICRRARNADRRASYHASRINRQPQGATA